MSRTSTAAATDVHVLLHGQTQDKTILIPNGKTAVNSDGVLVITQVDDDSVELGRFTHYQGFWCSVPE